MSIPSHPIPLSRTYGYAGASHTPPAWLLSEDLLKPPGHPERELSLSPHVSIVSYPRLFDDPTGHSLPCNLHNPHGSKPQSLNLYEQDEKDSLTRILPVPNSPQDVSSSALMAWGHMVRGVPLKSWRGGSESRPRWLLETGRLTSRNTNQVKLISTLSLV